MELQPRQLIVGVFTPPPGVPGGLEVTQAKLNQIWSEASPNYGYRQYQLAPDATGAVFMGGSELERVTIQPPLIQISDAIQLTTAQSAEKVESILSIIARHLTVNQFYNLGTRLIYQTPVADNDAKGFLMRVLGRTEEDLSELRAGENLWGGLKIGTGSADRQYTVVVEPLHRDPRFVYIDVDAQFPGPTTVDALPGRIKDVEQYLTHAVSSFLERSAN